MPSVNKLLNAWISSNTDVSGNVSLRCDGPTLLNGNLTVAASQTIDFTGSPPLMSGANIFSGTIPNTAINSGCVDLVNDQLSIYGQKTFISPFGIGLTPGNAAQFGYALDVSGDIYTNGEIYRGIYAYPRVNSNNTWISTNTFSGNVDFETGTTTFYSNVYLSDGPVGELKNKGIITNTNLGKYVSNGDQFNKKITTYTTSSTIPSTTSGCIIYCNPSTSGMVLTLPLLDSTNTGYWYQISVKGYDITLTAQSGNKIYQSNTTSITLKYGTTYSVWWNQSAIKDWSVSTAILPDGYVDTTTAQTVAGNKTFSGITTVYDISGNSCNLSQFHKYCSLDASGFFNIFYNWGGTSTSSFTVSKPSTQSRIDMGAQVIQIGDNPANTTYIGSKLEFQQSIPKYTGASTPTLSTEIMTMGFCDASFCNLTSAQTIAGVKTFSSLPESSAVPSTGNQLINKTYADATYGGSGLLTSANTWTNNNTWGSTADGKTMKFDSQYVSIEPDNLYFKTAPTAQYDQGITTSSNKSTKISSTAYGTTSSTTGYSNTMIGTANMFNNATNSVNRSVAIGDICLQNVASGAENIAIGYYNVPSATASSFNIGIGSYNLGLITTGISNAGIGNGNTFTVKTGSFNYGIGKSTCSSNGNSDSNKCIGIGAYATTNLGKIVGTNVIGNVGVGFCALNGSGNNTAGYNNVNYLKIFGYVLPKVAQVVMCI